MGWCHSNPLEDKDGLREESTESTVHALAESSTGPSESGQDQSQQDNLAHIPSSERDQNQIPFYSFYQVCVTLTALLKSRKL